MYIIITHTHIEFNKICLFQYSRFPNISNGYLVYQIPFDG